MVSQRDRILELVQYLESLGIEVNIGKNKARGNKGFFRADNKGYRIDIAKGQEDDSAIKTLVHEFAHYIHYNYDKTLKELDFILDSKDEDLTEELIKLTVDSIPKSSISPLFEAKEKLKQEIKSQKLNYLEAKLKQRALNRINSRISRLNKYYNSPTELFARSVEIYITDRDRFKNLAPQLLEYYDNAVKNNTIEMFTKLSSIFFEEFSI